MCVQTVGGLRMTACLGLVCCSWSAGVRKGKISSVRQGSAFMSPFHTEWTVSIKRGSPLFKSTVLGEIWRNMFSEQFESHCDLKWMPRVRLWSSRCHYDAVSHHHEAPLKSSIGKVSFLETLSVTCLSFLEVTQLWLYENFLLAFLYQFTTHVLSFLLFCELKHVYC